MFHQCVYQQISPKPTRMVLLRMQPFLRETRSLGNRGFCNHGKDYHDSLLGRDSDGNFKSAPAKVYTKSMRNAIGRSAMCHLRHLIAHDSYHAQSDALPEVYREFFAFTDFYGDDAVEEGAFRDQPDFAF